MFYLNKDDIEFQIFPNGECRLDISQGRLLEENEITWFYRDDSDIFQLALIDSVVPNYTLKIPYMPYSRMDRVEENTTAFSLKVLVDFLGDLKNCKKIKVLDPHSPKTLELLNEKGIIATEYGFSLSKKVLNQFDLTKTIVVFPDKGAKNRYNVSDYPNTITLNKTRDFKTGYIKGIEVGEKSGNLQEHFDIVFVDDLSSYGGTFYKGLLKIREAGFSGEANLIVTHAENTILKGNILDVFDRVYTTNSITTLLHPRIEQVNILTED